MLRNLLLAMLLLCGINSISFAQIGCDGDLEVQIQGSTETTSLSLVGDPVEPLCNEDSGDLTGSILITVTGGSPVYTFTWTMDGDPFSTDEDLTELGTGVYAVTVEDAVGCTQVDSWTITEPGQISISDEITDLNCHSTTGSADGVIDISPSGGTVSGDYSYNWASSTGGTGLVNGLQDQSNLSAGTYQVTVTDDNNCTAIAEYILSEPSAIATSANAQDPLCNALSGLPNGTITLQTTGGYAPYTYNWESSDGTGLINGDEDQADLSAGTYNLTITDYRNCTFEVQYVLGEPLAVVADGEGTNLDCHSDSGDPNGSIALDPSGGTLTGGADYSFNWETVDGSGLVAGQEDQSGLSAGVYNVTVTDSNNCTAVNMFTLTQPDAIVAAGSEVNPGCNADSGDANGTITMNPTGGTGAFSYAWETANGSGLDITAQNQTGLSAGTYSVTVTDSKNCTATNTFVLTEPAAIVAAGEEVNPGCNASSGDADGTITMDPTGGTGGYSYSWSTADGTGVNPTAQNQTGLSEGTYVVVVTDINNCTATNTFILTEPAAIVAAGEEVNPGCNVSSGDADGTITMDPTGGTGAYSYAWTTADGSGLDATAQNQTGLGQGTYVVVVSDINGCSATNTFVLTEPAAIVAAGEEVNPGCNVSSGDADGTITMDPTGGTGAYSYAWTTADGSGLDATAQNQTGLGQGTYVVVVSDINGCTASNTFVLTEPAAIVAAGEEVNPGCNVSSGDADGTITMDPTGGTGAYSYAWTTVDGSGLDATAQNQTGLGQGTYVVVVSDINGCTASNTFVLTEPAAIVAAGEEVNPGCNVSSGDADGTITMDPTGGTGAYSYAWTTADGSGLDAIAQNQTGLGQGTYVVVVSDINGCTASNTFVLTEPAAIVAAGEEVNPGCNVASGDADGTITMDPTGGTGAYSYAWTTADGSGLDATAQNQTGLGQGTYVVVVSDINGCTASSTFVLTEPAAIVAAGEGVNPGCNATSGDADGTITMDPTGGTGAYSYAWTTTGGSGLDATAQNQTGLSGGTYIVVVSDINGCSNSNTFVLEEPNAISCDLSSPILGTNNTNVSCYGDEAIITVAPTGGTGDFQFTLSGTDYLGNPVNIGPQAGTTFSVPSGNYTVTTEDVNGCSSVCNITITQPSALVAGTCTTDDLCQVNEGEIEVEAAGGVGPYTVTWTSDGGALDQISQVITNANGSVIFTGAVGGTTYIFTVTDENGCVIGG